MATATPAIAKEFNVLEKEAKKLIADGEIEKAGKIYTNFIEQHDNCKTDKEILALARNNRGHLRYLTVDFYGATEDYTKAIALDPCLAVAYYNRGQIHYRMGRFQLAIDDLEKAISLEPNFTDARDNLRQAKDDFAAKQYGH